MAKKSNSKVCAAHQMKWYTPKKQADLWRAELESLQRQFAPRK